MCLLLTDAWSQVASESLIVCLIYLLHASSVFCYECREIISYSGLFASTSYLDDPQMLEAASRGFSFYFFFLSLCNKTEEKEYKF